MEGWQRAFILHDRPWNETGLMLDAFTEESGRARLVVEDARSKRSILKGTLRPFIPLLLRFGGCGEAKTLRSAKTASLAPSLSDIILYSGLYVSEFFSRILEYETRFFKLFFDYLHCIQSLAGVTDTPEPVLRRFELVLLGHLGYGVGFTHYVGSGESVGDTMTYRYREEKGFIVSVVINNKISTGKQLKALSTWESPGADTLRAAKRFTRMALKLYFGSKSLKSKKLFWQFMPKRAVKTHYE